jgi:hypothetical protein
MTPTVFEARCTRHRDGRIPVAGPRPPEHHGEVRPTADSWRALARSSPWRWRTLHFTRHDAGRSVEAWVRRPGELLVRPEGDREEYVSGVPYGPAAIGLAACEPVPASRPERAIVLRPDGLVAQRPEDWHLAHSDPMWENYLWPAMLDPDELSRGVAVSDVHRDDREGRETWWARVVAESGYEPRCSCCPLLWSEVAARAEYGDEPDRLAQFTAEGYPDAHDVALDVQTGVMVVIEPLGGGRSGLGFTVAIHDADEDLDAVFAGRSAR